LRWDASVFGVEPLRASPSLFSNDNASANFGKNRSAPDVAFLRKSVKMTEIFYATFATAAERQTLERLLRRVNALKQKK